MKTVKLIFALAWGLVATAVVCAQDVEIRRLDGSREAGTLVALDTEMVTYAPSTGQRATVPVAEVVSIRAKGAVADVPLAGSTWVRFDMAGGDVVYGTISSSDYDTVNVDTRLVGPLVLPLEATSRVTVLANSGQLPRSAGSEIEADRDVLFLRSAKGVDHVIGDVARFTRDGVFFEWTDDGESLFRFKEDRVVAVRLAEPEAPEGDGEGLAATVWGRDGSRLTGHVAKAKGGGLRLALATGSTVTIDPDELALVTLGTERFTFVSDLEPETLVETPYLEGGLLFGLHRDEGLRGGVVVAGGVHFPRCLTMHSRTDVTYDLDGAYSRFSAGVALDDARADLPVRGAVTFTVLVDGKAVAGPVVRRGREEPVWLDVALEGASKLTLRADFADNYHFNGWAVWGAPVLVRSDDR